MKNRKFLRPILGALLLTKTLACGSQETAGGIYPEQHDTADAAAHAAFLAGWDYLLKKTPEDALRAIALFEKALEIDPDYSRAYAALAQAYWHNSRDTQFNKLLGEIQMASSIYGNDVIALEYLQKVGDEPVSQAHALTARMLQRQRRFEEAMREARTAVELGPEDATAHDALIENLIYAHELDEAIGFIDEALRLRPDFPGEKLFLKSLAYFTAERLEEALSAIESARNHNARQYRYAALHAAILAELGRLTEAKAAFEEYRSGLLNFERVNWTMFYWPFEEASDSERLAKSLIKAGLVDSPNHYYAVSRTTRLRTAEIKMLLARKTMIGADYGPSGSWEEFQVTRNQNAQIVGQDILTYFRDGETKIENDVLCDPWYELGEYCVAIYANPHGSPTQKNEYIFFTLEGIFAFSVFDPAN
jgi:tetratricopeptide (TPR) repeat protein